MVTTLGRPAAALLLGLCAGAATSFLQTGADQPWLALVNSASPWLVTAFVAGALQLRLGWAVGIGVLATVFEVVGYYGTAQLRGFGVSSSYVLLWSACALLGGPVAGAAGHLWRTGGRWAPAATALLPASFAAEALVTYLWRLGYTSSGVLFLVIAAGLFALLGLGHRQWSRAVAWMAGLLAAGCLGYVVLGLVV